MERHTKVNIWYFILAFLAVVWLRDAWIASRHVEQISYSEFQAALEQGRVEAVEVREGTIRGSYRISPQDAEASGEASSEGPHQFVTPRVDVDLAQELERYDVEFSGIVESTLFRQILSWVLPALVFVAIC